MASLYRAQGWARCRGLSECRNWSLDPACDRHSIAFGYELDQYLGAATLCASSLRTPFRTSKVAKFDRKLVTGSAGHGVRSCLLPNFAAVLLNVPAPATGVRRRALPCDSRGGRRKPTFEDDGDREAWLEVVGQALERFDASAFAYCLMGNHFHLVVQTRQPNLSRGRPTYRCQESAG